MAKHPFDQAKLTGALKHVLEISLPEGKDAETIKSNASQQRALLKKVRYALEFLAKIEGMVEEIQLPEHVFYLNNPATIGEVIAYKLEQLPAIALGLIRKFYGSGVYCFYYRGDYSAYRPISGTACPIYVGSAGPMVANAETPRLQGVKLFGRINEHLSRSLSNSRNLKLSDFTCRYLVVQSGLEKAAEDFLIKMYRPVWNKESGVCAGIGKHGDKARQELSDWDILHGGRKWAESQKSSSGMTVDTIHAKIDGHFRGLFVENSLRWKKIFNREWCKELES